jgi:hypothetical protein
MKDRKIFIVDVEARRSGPRIQASRSATKNLRSCARLSVVGIKNGSPPWTRTEGTRHDLIANGFVAPADQPTAAIRFFDNTRSDERNCTSAWGSGRYQRMRRAHCPSFGSSLRIFPESLSRLPGGRLMAFTKVSEDRENVNSIVLHHQ